MRKILISIAVPALVAASAPALAQTAQQNPRARDGNTTEQRAEGQNADERRICVNERLSTSRMPRRVCRTRSEWEAMHGSDEERTY
jgi:hypothetical protein